MSETTEQTQAAPQPELTISDLQNIRSIIEVASKRGAFGAGEMSAIGSVFDKLSTFLAAVAPQQAPAAEGTEEAPAAE
jgi:hypothetical protein